RQAASVRGAGARGARGGTVGDEHLFPVGRGDRIRDAAARPARRHALLQPGPRDEAGRGRGPHRRESCGGRPGRRIGGRVREEDGEGVLHLERLTRITDVHVHIQPWRDLKPKVQEAMRRGKEAHWELLISVMDDPKALLEILDRSGVWRVGMVNYPSPDVMGFTNTTNTFAARYAAANPERLLPYGGVDARHTKDPAGDVDRPRDLGIRRCTLHPPHQRYAANAYTDGLDALGRIYRRCEERGPPVMVHTGTSIFPGARSKYGNPMELDDVAIDFPDLRIVMAHGGRPLYMEEAFFILRRHANVW